MDYLRTAELRTDVLLEGSVRVVAAAVAPKAAAEHVGLRHSLQWAAAAALLYHVAARCITVQHGAACR